MVTETDKTRNPLASGPAERMQEVRDLRDQIGALTTDPEEQREILIRETSPLTRKVPVYSMTDGEEIHVPLKLLELVLAKRDPRTRQYMFTAYKDQAPKYKKGEVKCFLHPEAADRVILDEIGLGAIECPAAHLANNYSKRMHAQHRHKQEWAMYQEFLAEQREEQYNQRQEQQLEATLAIAKAAGVQASQAKPKTGGA
jgi:hypothetical protein